MTYKLECPGCEKEFQIEADPAIAFVDGGDLIPCPHCKEVWEWDHDAEETPALMLLPDSYEGDDEEEDDDETPGRLDDEDDDDDFTDEDEEDDEYRV